jgi:hypothetical protein
MVFGGDGRPKDRPETVRSDEADVTFDPLDLHTYQVEQPTEHGRERL